MGSEEIKNAWERLQDWAARPETMRLIGRYVIPATFAAQAVTAGTMIGNELEAQVESIAPVVAEDELDQDLDYPEPRDDLTLEVTTTTTTLPPPAPEPRLEAAAVEPECALITGNGTCIPGNKIDPDSLTEAVQLEPFLAAVNAPEQLEQIYSLLEQVEVSPDRYRDFKFNLSREGTFSDAVADNDRKNHMNGRVQRVPKAGVAHWTGKGFTGVDDFIDFEKKLGFEPHVYTEKDGVAYLLLPLHFFGDHAKFANHTMWGNENHALGLHELTPAQLETNIYIMLWFFKEYQQPMLRSNWPTHAEIVRSDLIKIDWASELQDGLWARLLELNHRVYVLGEGGHPNPLAPTEPVEESTGLWLPPGWVPARRLKDRALTVVPKRI